MNPGYPLEQMALCTDGSSRHAFAQKARELLCGNDDIALEVTDDGR